MSNGTEFEKNFLRDFVYYIYADHQPKLFWSVYQQSFWTWKWRQDDTEASLLLSALFFTCFFALLFLLENQAGASAVRVNKQLGYGVATWKRGHHYIYIYIYIYNNKPS